MQKTLPARPASQSWSDLYLADETAWLDAMADLIQHERIGELDYEHLAEYLADMAKRDRREVESRLTVLLTHLLKWQHQPERRSHSWRGTIIRQRQELARDLSGGVLKQHAEAVLASTYPDAGERAAAETGMPRSQFPQTCPYTLDQALAQDLSEDISS